MTRRWLLLKLLQEAGPVGVTTGELLSAGVGSRYGARLLELRDEGYVVESRRERQSSFRYILIDEPELDSPPTEASASGGPAIKGSVGLPRPEYQAGAGASVGGEQGALFSVAAEPRPHYREQAA